jgi:hypothetical protein
VNPSGRMHDLGRAIDLYLGELAATGIAAIVAAVTIALNFTPRSWLPVVAALILTGLIYGGIGALVGVLLDRVAATYAILFIVAADLSVVQTPMFHASPSRYAPLLPGYGPTRVMLDGAFARYSLHGFRS